MIKKITVLISGGGSGLGLLVIKKLLINGFNVATFSRKINPELETLCAEYSNFYWESIDISQLDRLQHYVTQVKKQFGKIDILINNVGYLYEGLFSLTPNKEIDKTISTNITGPLLLTKEVLKSMIKNKSGNIINVSSINSSRGHKGVSIYSMSKAAIDGWGRSLAKELGPFNIRVNSVVPGFFDSQLVSYLSDERKKQILKRTPLNRLGTIEDISNVILFLCGDKSSFITGQSLTIDGGITC
jgi:3-oxoacyl-[acyl-carrier protein] reductase